MNRPDHPDFALLSAILQELDGLSDRHVPLPEIIAPIDAEVASYVAIQRAMRIPATPGEHVQRLSQGEMQRQAAAWMDGMVTGYRLRQAHEKPADPEVLAQLVVEAVDLMESQQAMPDVGSLARLAEIVREAAGQ